MAEAQGFDNPSFFTSDHPDRARFREHFKDHAAATHTKRWNDLWVEGFLPWDRGVSNPALVDTLSQRKDLLGSPVKADGARKRALVPGCGRGYDVLLLASFGYDAYGLEASENALGACREFEAQNGDQYDAKDQNIGKGSINWVSGDFFSSDWLEKVQGGIGEGFDLIYDYTVSN